MKRPTTEIGYPEPTKVAWFHGVREGNSWGGNPDPLDPGSCFPFEIVSVAVLAAIAAGIILAWMISWARRKR